MRGMEMQKRARFSLTQKLIHAFEPPKYHTFVIRFKKLSFYDNLKKQKQE